jgi:hypothetical protein
MFCANYSVVFLSDRRRYSDDERCEETGSGYQLAGSHFLHTASQGGLFAEAEPEAVNKTLPETEPGAKNKTLPEAEPETENKTLAESEPEAENKTLSEAEPEAENKTPPKAKPEAENKTLPEAEPDAENKTFPEAGAMVSQTPISNGLEGRTVQQAEVHVVLIVRCLKFYKRKTLSKERHCRRITFKFIKLIFEDIFWHWIFVTFAQNFRRFI